MALSPIKPMRKTGAEPFRTGGIGLDFTLLDFWQWAASDLVGNTTRGRLAEFIVARALGLGITDLRNEWESFDLVTPSNLKVEVKSAAYIQSWFQKTHSNICFVVSTRHGWDSATNVLDPQPRRHADVYVFALLSHLDKASIDPLDLSQWQFYVVPTSVLDDRKRSQYSITLKSLVGVCPRAVTFLELPESVENAGQARKRRPER